MGTDQEGRRRKKRKASVNQASGAESLNTNTVQLGSDTCPRLQSPRANGFSMLNQLRHPDTQTCISYLQSQ